MSERDPRQDPRPGDVLIDDFYERAVQAFDPVHGIIDFTLGTGGGGWCKIAFWRRELSGAVVLKRAEDGAAQPTE